MPKPLLHALRSVAAAALVMAVPLRAAEKVADADSVVELPQFVVSETPIPVAFESFRYATLPGIEILSSAPDRDTRQLFSDFELFRAVLAKIWPMPDAGLAPLTVLVCGQRTDFEKFIPDGASSNGMRTTNLMKARNRAALVVDLAAKVIDIETLDVPLSRDEAVEDTTQMVVMHNEVLRREYVRYLLSRSDPRLPAWFEEGLTQIVMRMTINPDFVEIGRLEPPNTISAEAESILTANASGPPEAPPLPAPPAGRQEFYALIESKPLMPFGEFFAVGHDAPQATAPHAHILWSTQAYALVHMCMFGQGGKWQKPLGQFLVRSGREPLTEALFQQCFGKTYSEMSFELKQYAGFTDYEAKQYRAKGGARLAAETNLELREATDAEIGRIKGYALLMAGRTTEARAAFIAPYLHGVREPQILAALGMIERDAGKHERARKFLTAALTAKSSDPDAYFQLAQYRFADAVAAPAGRDGRFSAEQTSGIVELLKTGRAFPPQNPLLHELLAETWVRSAVRPQQDEILPLISAVQRFPARLKLAYATAVLCADGGLRDAAKTLVQHGLKFAPDPASRAGFEQLNAKL